MRHRFDEIDRKILAQLQVDGRITNVDLSAKVGITAPPCLRRVRALEEAGAIHGYHAVLDAEQLGYAMTAFAFVSLKSQAEDDLKAFEAHVEAMDSVRECYMMSGEIDFVLKIVAHDLQDFQRIVTAKLTSAPNVESVKTALSIRSSKVLPGVPVDMV